MAKSKLTFSSVEVSHILKLDNQVCFPFYAASRLMTQAYAPLLKKFDITYPQYLVLLVLWESNNLSVKEIGEKLLLDSGTITPVMKSLEATGYIERVRDSGDERVVLGRLTEKGRALKPKAAKMSYELFCLTKMDIDEATKIRENVKDVIKKYRA